MRTSLIPQGWHHFFGESFYFLFPLWPTADDELKRHVLDTDVLEFLQRRDELLRVAYEVLVVLGHRIVGEVDRTATTQVRRLGSTDLGRDLLNVGVLGSQPLGGNLHVIGEPGISVFGCALYCGFAFSTRPDWEARFLNRPWADRHCREIVILPLETGTLLFLELVEDLQLFVSHSPSFVERRDTKCLELFNHPADADTQDQSPI